MYGMVHVQALPIMVTSSCKTLRGAMTFKQLNKYSKSESAYTVFSYGVFIPDCTWNHGPTLRWIIISTFIEAGLVQSPGINI